MFLMTVAWGERRLISFPVTRWRDVPRMAITSVERKVAVRGLLVRDCIIGIRRHTRPHGGPPSLPVQPLHSHGGTCISEQLLDCRASTSGVSQVIFIHRQVIIIISLIIHCSQWIRPISLLPPREKKLVSCHSRNESNAAATLAKCMIRE